MMAQVAQVSALVLASLGLGFWIWMQFNSLLAIYLIRHMRGIRQKTRRSKGIQAKKTEGVTILRPLCGMDNYLELCLRTSFEMDYDNVEVILCVAKEDDPATSLARRMIAEYPNIDASLVIGEMNVGVNPKLNNLASGFFTAKNDVIWMYDSNICMRPESLETALNLLNGDSVGLVHHLPRGQMAYGLGGRLEAAYLATSHARMYIAINGICSLANRIGIPASCITGKSLMLRRSTLEQCNFFEHIGMFLGEDNIIGHEISSLGKSCVLAPDIASQLLGKHSVTNYADRRIRWSRLRLFLVPAATLFEPLTECVPCVALCSFSLSYFFSASYWLSMLLLTAMWMLIDVATNIAINGHVRGAFTFVGTWLCMELMYFPLLLQSFMSNTVVWRGRNYRLMVGGKAVQIAMDNTDAGLGLKTTSVAKIIDIPSLSTSTSNSSDLVEENEHYMLAMPKFESDFESGTEAGFELGPEFDEDNEETAATLEEQQQIMLPENNIVKCTNVFVNELNSNDTAIPTC